MVLKKLEYLNVSVFRNRKVYKEERTRIERRKMEEEIYCKYCNNKGIENFMEYFDTGGYLPPGKGHFYRCKKCKKDNLYPFDIRVENKNHTQGKGCTPKSEGNAEFDDRETCRNTDNLPLGPKPVTIKLPKCEKCGGDLVPRFTTDLEEGDEGIPKALVVAGACEKCKVIYILDMIDTKNIPILINKNGKLSELRQ